MNKIFQLPTNLANMIAAGEVVERPSSVVKELVENSIDAGATTIKIDLIESGLKKITVLDNGSGMSQDDLKLAFRRHATSKIKTVEDLFKISTLGFRGEALPSIASVAILTLTSNPGLIDGYFYQVKAGEIIDEGKTQLPTGTRIEVENLFFNTPARYKHLGNLYQEQSAVVDYLYKSALSHPEITFSLTNNNKSLFYTSGSGDVTEIIGAAYGIETAKSLIYFEGKNHLYEIFGYTTNNQVFRSNRNAINIIINGRVIRNLPLIYAVSDAYQQILPVGKYPITSLFIKVDPILIDVNVHPAKLEIRLTDEADLKQLITETIKQSLTLRPLFVSIQSERVETKKHEKIDTTQPIKTSDDWWTLFEDASVPKIDKTIPLTNKQEVEQEDQKPISENYEQKPIIEKYEQKTLETDSSFFQNLVFLGQYHETYLLLEDSSNLYLIDQHAAMERIMYERISANFLKPTNQCYDLLIPITLDFSLSEIPLILNLTADLSQMGINIEPFGGPTIIVRTVPDWIPQGLETEFLHDIINHLLGGRNVNKQKMYDSLAKSLSCKQSIKANMKISSDEVNQLLSDLDNCQIAYTCPHGRPTLVKFTNYEIEKMFKRVI